MTEHLPLYAISSNSSAYSSVMGEHDCAGSPATPGAGTSLLLSGRGLKIFRIVNRKYLETLQKLFQFNNNQVAALGGAFLKVVVQNI